MPNPGIKASQLLSEGCRRRVGRRKSQGDKAHGGHQRSGNRSSHWPRERFVLGTMILIAGMVAYWPTLTALAQVWTKDPDYAHGVLVMPLAVCFLWLRRQTFPGMQEDSPRLAMSLLLTSLAMRYVGGRFYYPCLEGWSLIAWTAAVASLLGGRRLLWWASPSICFLFFMIPLPYAWEGQLAYPLQRIATIVSTSVLQLLGQPAFAEDTTILLEQRRLQVAPACCGIRLFMTTFALVFALMVIIRRTWWEMLGLLVAALPIALAANAARIVFVALSFNTAISGDVRNYLHDFAGVGATVFAAGALLLLLWYLRYLFQEVDIYDAAQLVREAKLGS